MSDITAYTGLALHIFWFVATVTSVLAIGLEVKHRGTVASEGVSARVPLAKSQEKDNWLICAIVWSAFWTEGWQFQNLASMCETLILLWIAKRTIERFRVLG